MIQLTSKTTVALLVALMRNNYGISWYAPSDRDGFITVGMHLPTGEIAYHIPEEYQENLRGMIELPKADVLTTAFEDDSAERLLDWVQTV